MNSDCRCRARYAGTSMRALIWYVLAIGWGIESGISFFRHQNGHAVLTAVIALIFAFVGWMVRRHDRRQLRNRKSQ